MTFKNFILTCVMAFIALPAMAQTFDKLSSLPGAYQQTFEKTKKAVFVMGGERHSRCTGTYISNKGHAITAGHCLERCFSISPDTHLKWPVESKRESNIAKVSGFTRSYPQRCVVNIKGVKTEIEILSGPKGFLPDVTPYEVLSYIKNARDIHTQEEANSYKSIWLNKFKEGWGLGGDVVVFKTLSNDKKTECASFSKSLNLESPKYILGYPGWVPGADKANTELYLSTGNAFYADYFLSRSIPFLDKTGDYLVSDLEAYVGSSGSSLIDQSTGNISGILSMVAGRPSYARFIGLKKIKEISGSALDNITCD